MDFVASHPIPPRLRAPLRDVLAGRPAAWPEHLTADEVASLDAHGLVPIAFAATNAPELRDGAIRAAALEELRAHDIRDVLSVLGGRGIDVLVIKGSALAWQIYASPGQRPRGDTDLFVSVGQMETVRSTLVEAGFREVVSSGDEHGVMQSLFRRHDSHGVHHVYDVHWEVVNAPAFASVLRFEEVRRRSVAIPQLGEHAFGLCRVDALLLACIHRVAHHHDSERLIWLADIALLRDSMSDEEHRAFWRRAADGRVVGVCMRSIELANEWCGREERYPAGAHLAPEEIDRSEPSRVFLDRRIRYAGVLAANLRALPWRLRTMRLWQLAFPPEAYMRGSGDTAPLAWLYARRGVRSIRRLFMRAATPGR